LLGDANAPTDKPAAHEAYTHALALWKALVEKNPDVPRYKAETAGVWFSLGILASSDDEPPAPDVRTTLTHSDRPPPSSAEGKLSLLQARRLLQPLVNAYPKVLAYRRDLAKALQAIAYLESVSGDVESARKNFQTAADLFAKLIDERPQEVEYLQHYAAVLNDWGNLEFERGTGAAAVAVAQRECQQREVLAKALSEDPLFEFDLAESLERLATAHEKNQNAAAAKQQYERAEKILLSVSQRLPMDEAVSDALKRIQAALAKAKPAGEK
jgi:tetratricopeptide (TPR) repeat protein